MLTFGTPYYILLTLAVVSTIIIMFALYSLDENKRVKLPLIGYIGMVLSIPIPYLNIIPLLVLLGYMGKNNYIAIKSSLFGKLIKSLTEDY